jgi:hypothetical protein
VSWETTTNPNLAAFLAARRAIAVAQNRHVVVGEIATDAETVATRRRRNKQARQSRRINRRTR